MDTDYTFVSPSLEGVFRHDAVMYEGIARPTEIMRSFDKGTGGKPHEKKLLERYFYDLYGVFTKNLSAFVLDSGASAGDALKLQAMLQEMIKVKKLMTKG